MQTVLRTPVLSSESGKCTVKVTIPAFNNPSLVFEIELEVVLVDTLNLHILHYNAKSPGSNLFSLPIPAYGPETLHKVGCGGANYQQVSTLRIHGFGMYNSCTYIFDQGLLRANT